MFDGDVLRYATKMWQHQHCNECAVLCLVLFALQLDGELFTLSYKAEGGMLCYMRPLLHVCEKSVFSDMYTLSCPGILASLTLC